MSVYEILMQEKGHPEKNGLYRLTQILFAYNSNHIEGNALSKEQTRYIYETNSFLAEKDTAVKVNDVLDVRNHFRAFDYMLESFCELIVFDESVELPLSYDIENSGDFDTEYDNSKLIFFESEFKTDKALQVLIDKFNNNELD